MKNYKVLKIFNIILFFYLSFLSMGYAFFNEALTVNGVAKTVDFYSGSTLPNEGVIRDKVDNRYFTANGSKDKVFFNGENWSPYSYRLNFKKVPGILSGKKTITYTITIKNPTVLQYTNGTIKSQIGENYGNRISSVHSELSKKTVQPGETFDILITVTFDFPTAVGNNTVKTRITYNCQNSIKNFDIYLTYSFGW